MDPFYIRTVETKNLPVKLTKTGEALIRKRHPWIFEDTIQKISNDISAGDRAVIFDKKNNKLIGIGLIDPDSPIRIKMLLYEKGEIGLEWFKNKLSIALIHRTELREKYTNSFRWIFGENDGLPGLVLDVYKQVVVIKLYSAIWLPYWNSIIDAIIGTFQDITAIVLRLSRNTTNIYKSYGLEEGKVVFGTLTNSEITFHEHDVLFSANVIKGHKTGYFLDHRANRNRIGKMSSGKDVLDVFCYTGGFSVHALVGKAKSVTSLDISKQALIQAQQNAKLNGDFSNHFIIAGDAFDQLKILMSKRKKYDLIVLDPPAFAKSKAEIPQAISSYERLLRLGISLCRKDAYILFASCSSRIREEDLIDIIRKVFKNGRRRYNIIDKTSHDVDHPIRFPEGRYLKSIYLKLD